MALTCPNKNDKEFIALKDAVGEDAAYFLWNKYSQTPVDFNSLRMSDNMTDAAYQVLRDRKLVHKWNGRMFLSKNAYERIDEVYTTCSALGVDFNYTETANATLINLSEKLDILQNKDVLNFPLIRQIVSDMSKRFPGLNVVLITSKLLPMYDANADAKAFIRGNTVYLCTDRITPESTIEEFVHPLVKALEISNPELFDSLLAEAKLTFPKLFGLINYTYTESRGFTLSDRNNELVAKVLAKRIGKNYYYNEPKSFSELVNKFCAWVYDIIKSILTPYGLTGLSFIHPEDIHTLTLEDLSNLIYTNDIAFLVNNPIENKTVYSLLDGRDNQNYQQRLALSEVLLKRLIGGLKEDLNNSLTEKGLEQDLSNIRTRLIEGFTVLQKMNKSSENIEYKNAVNHTLTNLLDNTIEDVDVISRFTLLIANEVVPISNEILEATSGTGLPTSRIVELNNNFFEFYAPLVEQVHNIFSQLKGLDTLEKSAEYNQMYDILNKVRGIMQFSLNNLSKIMINSYKKLSADYALSEGNSYFMEEMFKSLAYDPLLTDKDVTKLTSAFMSIDKVNDPAMKVLYSTVRDACNKRDYRVFQKAYLLNSALRDIKPHEFKQFYETDAKGNTTGYLIRDLLYGVMNRDIHNMINKFKVQLGIEPNTPFTAIDPVLRNKFVQLKNEWLKHHVERLYTAEYYELFDNLSDEAKHAKESIDNNINLIRNKYLDKDGNFREAYITDDNDKFEYKEYLIQRKLLASIYNQDGTEKSGIERQIAEELTNLYKQLGEEYSTRFSRSKFKDIIEQHRRELSDEEFQKWYKTNVRKQFTEEFRELLSLQDEESYGEEYTRLRLKYRDMINPYRDSITGEVMINRMPAKTLNYLNSLENQIAKERRKNKSKPKSNKLKLFKVVTTEEYRKMELAIYKSIVSEVATDDVIDLFAVDSLMEARFYSKYAHQDAYGNWIPNLYFTKIVPIDDKYMEEVPTSSFNELSKQSKFYNKNYDYNNKSEYYQPKRFATEDFTDSITNKKYRRGLKLYDNTAQFDKIRNNNRLYEAYKILLQTMEEANGMYPNRRFVNNYLLPLITGSMYKFIKSLGIRKGIINKIINGIARKSDDIELGNKDIVSPSGKKVNFIPQSYTQMLDDPGTISQDLVGIIMEYYSSAVNYDEKSKIRDKCELIKTILSKRVYKKGNKRKEGTSTNLYDMAQSFLDMNLYDIRTKLLSLSLFNKEVDITKLLVKGKNIATLINLGFNIAVAATGGFTSAYQNLVLTIVGRYWDKVDAVKAMKDMVFDLIWNAWRSIGNRHYNSLLTALMDESNIGSEARSLWENSNHNKVIVALFKRLAWTGMTVSDYINKGFVLNAVLYNHKLVNGEILCKEDYIAKYGKSTSNKWNDYKSIKDLLTFKNGEITTKDLKHKKLWLESRSKIYDIARALAQSADGQLTALQKASITSNALGGYLMMHRQYIPVVTSERFLLEYQYDPNYHRYREAVLRTMFRYVSSIYSDYRTLGIIKSFIENTKKFKLDVVAKSNLKLGITEATLLLLVFPQIVMLSFANMYDDDDDWFKKMFAYVMLRTYFESSTPYNISDLFNTIKTPTPAFGAIDTLRDLPISIYDWITGKDNKTIRSGAYKDKSKLFRLMMKSTPFKNLYEQIGDINSKIRYYENQIVKEDFSSQIKSLNDNINDLSLDYLY